jgi:hypothetical protein
MIEYGLSIDGELSCYKRERLTLNNSGTTV